MAKKRTGHRRAEARLRAARLFLEAGRHVQAKKLLKAIGADVKARRATRARATLLLCNMTPCTKTSLEKLVKTYPDTVAGEDALQRLLDLLRPRGHQSVLQTLQALYDALKGSNMADNILYAMAHELAGAKGAYTLLE